MYIGVSDMYMFLIGEMLFFFSIEFSKLHVPGKMSCVIWYTFDLVPI